VKKILNFRWLASLFPCLWQIRREQPIPGQNHVATQWVALALLRELWQRGVNQPRVAKAKPDDDVTVILPSVGVQVTDEDNLQDEIDTINDKINHYKDVVDNLTPRDHHQSVRFH
jgi:hypothetical protein